MNKMGQSQYDGGEPNQEFSGDQTENILCNTEKSACIETIVKDVCIEDPSEIQKDINILSSSGLLTDQVKQRLSEMQSNLPSVSDTSRKQLHGKKV